MTRARNDDDEWELQQDREMGDGPEPGDQFGSAPVPLDEPFRPALVEGPTADGGYNAYAYAYAKDGTRRLVHIPAR